MDNMPAVQVANLTVQYGDFTAVDNITFQVSPGEIFGFLGANGAGKTTTIRVLCGLLIPARGKVIVGGHDIYKDERKIKSIVGYMSQRFTLYDDMTVDENLDFIAALRKISPQIYKKRKKDLLQFISFENSPNVLVGALSAGEKQHVSLAASLLHDPQIVFLDEPTAGVSPTARARFWSLIKRLSNDQKTVFVTTHYMDEVEQCEKIALMRNGQIVALDTPGNLKSSTFPNKVYEFVPLFPMKFDDMKSVSSDPMFEFFEPYGLRFHVALRNKTSFVEMETKYAHLFRIGTIEPSLEDVFIKTVESGGSHEI